MPILCVVFILIMFVSSPLHKIFHRLKRDNHNNDDDSLSCLSQSMFLNVSPEEEKVKKITIIIHNAIQTGDILSRIFNQQLLFVFKRELSLLS